MNRAAKGTRRGYVTIGRKFHVEQLPNILEIRSWRLETGNTPGYFRRAGSNSGLLMTIGPAGAGPVSASFM